MTWLLKIISTLFVLVGFSLTAVGVNNLNQKLEDVEGRLGETPSTTEDIGAEITAAREEGSASYSSRTLPASSILPETFGGDTDYVFPGNLGIKGGQLFLTPISEGQEQEGTIYYDDDNDKVYVRGSTGWIDLAQQDSHGSISGLIGKPTNSTQGDILYRNATTWERLAAGTSGYFLKTQGASANPTWDAAPTDPTSATLVIAASDSNDTSRADYVADGTDDQVQIQAAIDALPAGGGKVVLLEGTYYLTEGGTEPQWGFSYGVGIDKPIRLEGSGTAVLTVPNNVTKSASGIELLAILSTEDVTIDGIIFNGNASNQSSGKVYGIYLYNTTRANVINNEIYDTNGYAVQIDALTTETIVTNNFIHDTLTTSGHAITAHNGGASSIIANNILDTIGGYGLFVDSVTDVDIVGNYVENPLIGIAVTDSASRVVAIGNTVIGSNGMSQALLLSSGCDGNVIVGNLFDGHTQYQGELDVDSDNNIITNNRIVDTTLDNSGSGNVIRNNVGFVTENSGTATVANGQTIIDVTHGLSVTPTANDVQVTPTNDLGNATKFWISDLGASTFRINVDGDPGASTATFAWSAAVY